MSNEHLTPKQDTYLTLQLEIAAIAEETSRLFYWASRNDRHISKRFSVEKADALYDIMWRGRDHTETMVRCYFKTDYSMHGFELEKMQKWAENINKNMHLFDGIYSTRVKESMVNIERCFEAIISNEWVR